MRVRQLSVFVENKSGRLAKVVRSLAQGGVNIRAMSLADTADFGILRLIVDNSDAGLSVLKEAGFAVTVTSVVAAVMPDTPGSLATVLDALDAKGINIEYMYAFVGKTAGQAVVVLRVETVDEAAAALQASGIDVLDELSV